MTDLLLELSRRPRARRLLSSLSLPLPMPEPLRRAEGALTLSPLQGRRALLSSDGELHSELRAALDAAGASPSSGFDGDPDALVFDATALETPAQLSALYDFFHPRRVAVHGRALVIARPKHATESAAKTATRFALEGFVRSLAKELGRRAATALLLEVEPSAEANLAPVLRFALSDRSAFVTGQRLHVGSALGFADPPECSLEPALRSLAGQDALVTGAARGIGLAIARRLAEEGARVTLLDRPSEAEELERLASTLAGRALAVDLAHHDAASKIADSFPEGVDVVVHNAGVTRDRTLARMSDESWRLALDVNLGAPLRITQALLDADRLRAGGRLLFLSSVAGLAGNVGQTNYAASKAGLLGLVQAWSAQLAPRRIAVNALAPGFIETDMTAAMPWAIRQAARRLSALGQGGLPEDVAEAALFLSLPEARGITGQTLRVCGGALVGA